MDNKDIKIIRERLSDYQSPVNTDKAWASFSAKSNVSASKLFLIKSLGAITAIALLGIFVWTMKGDEKAEFITNESSLKEATEASKTSPTTADVETTETIQTITSEQFTPEHKTYKTAIDVPQKEKNVGETGASSRSNPTNYSKGIPVLYTIAETNKTAKTVAFVQDILVELEDESPQLSDTVTTAALADRDSAIQHIDSALVSTQTSVIDTQQTLLNPKYSPKHSVFLAYNVGVREQGGLFLSGITAQTLSTDRTSSSWRPHGHQSMVLGYEYAIRPKINLHGAVAYGLGYLNGQQGFSGKTTISVKQQEWGAEIAGIATLLKHKKVKTEVGVGASARTFTLNYTAGANTTVTGIHGTLNPGETSTFKDQSIVALALVRLNFQLPIDNLAFRLSGIYQTGGDYARHSFRGGLSYTF